MWWWLLLLPVCHSVSTQLGREIYPCRLSPGSYRVNYYYSKTTFMTVLVDESRMRLGLDSTNFNAESPADKVWYFNEKGYLQYAFDTNELAPFYISMDVKRQKYPNMMMFVQLSMQQPQSIIPWCDRNGRVYLQAAGSNWWLTKELDTTKTASEIFWHETQNPRTAFEFTPFSFLDKLNLMT